ncbi:uncharacterized protein LOC111338647 [Stylophora pistillata]|uniref:uncharacterized protein LOC111338647 n=1 Tax=Stylophora pistillata TaxID=50429 RepID=UPI000C03AC65|nr:uncharacterized protein LOC111338647 [Stylophora pistillata]XP_022800900.1 uncharacterized protein LOC111338647 [Stylophora pistillata]
MASSLPQQAKKTEESTPSSGQDNGLQLPEWKRGTKVIGLFKFEASRDDDLSFHKGEELVIEDHHEGNRWFSARNSRGVTGYIPCSHVKEKDLLTNDDKLFKAEQDAAPEKNASTESNAAPGKHAAELFATKKNAGPQKNAAPESNTAPGKNAAERIVWSPGTRVMGKYAFKGRDSEDLPFKKGEILIIETVTRVSPYENLAKLFGIAYGTGKKVYFRATSCL